MKLFNRILKILILIIIAQSYLAIANESQQQINGSNYFNLFNNKSEINYERLFKEVMEKTKLDYVEEVTDKKLIESAIEGMLSSLDPHSTFLNEKEFQDIKISTKGEFGGFGIEVTMDKGFIKVISPYEDGPAHKAGIKAGDYITMIEGIVVKGMTLTQAVDKLRGKPKTKIKITVYREATSESFETIVTREIVKIIPVKAKLIANNVAFIKVTTFSENTANLVKKEFHKLVEQARDKNTELSGLIIDFRWNPGGLLEQAREVAELFLEDAIILTTKGRIPEANQILRATATDITEGLPIVVLINGGSASSSEIVAGALQDNRRALVVGTKSFGKGSVQTVLPLSGNTAMKLTTSRYYTPSGKAIQANGIDPDVVVEEAVLTPLRTNTNNLSEASLIGHLQKEPEASTKSNSLNRLQSISATLDAKDLQDYQLLRAIDVVKGMALYSERLAN